ncbi:MAG TPA: hypothetical protein VF576_10185, partial [Rubricoccaceae bacterium]
MRPIALLAVLLFAAGGPALAQGRGTPASGFVRADGTLDLAGAPAGAVDAAGLDVTMGADGTLRAGTEGEFRDISNGPTGPPLDGVVYALAVGPDGSVYAGGVLWSSGGVPLGGVARRVGKTWEPLGSGVDGE